MSNFAAARAPALQVSIDIAAGARATAADSSADSVVLISQVRGSKQIC